MMRLNIIAEGQTEEDFVNKVLIPHLWNFGVYVSVRCVMTSKDKRINKIYRGGLLDYKKAKADILSWLTEDKKTILSTMFDLYALPDNFPNYQIAKQENDPYERVKLLEDALRNDLPDEHRWRFIPYIQLHEFEALVLVDPTKLLDEYIERDKAIANLQELMENNEPELVNDGVETAPSKRIIREIPEYDRDKRSSGVKVTAKIGIEKLKLKCPHFSEWVGKLEKLSAKE